MIGFGPKWFREIECGIRVTDQSETYIITKITDIDGYLTITIVLIESEDLMVIIDTLRQIRDRYHNSKIVKKASRRFKWKEIKSLIAKRDKELEELNGR
jgi:hypothetical protein